MPEGLRRGECSPVSVSAADPLPVLSSHLASDTLSA
jgi:hypothetical protein